MLASSSCFFLLSLLLLFNLLFILCFVRQRIFKSRTKRPQNADTHTKSQNETKKNGTNRTKYRQLLIHKSKHTKRMISITIELPLLLLFVLPSNTYQNKTNERTNGNQRSILVIFVSFFLLSHLFLQKVGVFSQIKRERKKKT